MVDLIPFHVYVIVTAGSYLLLLLQELPLCLFGRPVSSRIIFAYNIFEEKN
jgi:hypothetical protein